MIDYLEETQKKKKILKRIGPATVEVEPKRKGGENQADVSATYRNINAADGIPTTVKGKHTMLEAFEQSVEKYADRKCLGWRPIDNNGEAQPYEYMTYKEAGEKAKNIGSALLHKGLQAGGKVGVYAANCPEWMLMIRGCDTISATIVPIYDSLGETAVEYITKHSELEFALVESKKMASYAAVADAVAGQVKAVIYIGKEDEKACKMFEKAGIEVISWEDFLDIGRQHPMKSFIPPSSEDLACIMYTSGTTGTPKGVMISHRALVSGVAGAINMIEQTKIGISETDSLFSFLPLAHIYGRLLEDLALTVGASIGYWQGDVKKIMDDLVAFKPTLFVTVPRILERVCDGVEKKLAEGSSVKRAIFNVGLSIKSFLLKQGVPHSMSGIGVDSLIFSKLKAALGGRVRFIVSGGAPLASHVEDFSTATLAPVLQGYGLTESCAASFIMLTDPRMAHTVGPPLLCTEFRFESVPELGYSALDDIPKGEIMIRSPMLFSGYLKDEEKTAEAFDSEGFFHTGDIGTITPQGCLKIIDRKKNIFKLAQGEYVAVEYVEGIFSRNKNVEQIWVYGSSLESALVAIVVPKESWATSYPELNSSESRNAMLEDLLKTGKEAKLKGFEMIRNVHLDSEPFSVENDLMTPSMKLKRPQLQKHYEEAIASMYAEMKKKQRK